MDHTLYQFAHDAGFDQVGVVRLEANSKASQYFAQWIEKGFGGQMSYLERGAAKRADPSLVLTQAKSILMLRSNYFQQTPLDETGLLSRYVGFEDYHTVLIRRLESFLVMLQERYPDAVFRPYVDTGPILEKDWAARAGLGWIGKHTNLIHPQDGSYFFLASVLADLDLSESFPSQKITDHCGKCEACITVCPTRAIVAPYVLDARLCISYLTIELKGPIPRDLRPLIGVHIYGCDDCQAVCPWNRRAKTVVIGREVQENKILDFLSLSEREFKERFAKSAVLRTKRRGFLRNVCVVAGNLKLKKAVPQLIQLLKDPEPLVRGHAAWALSCFQDPTLVDLFKQQLLLEEDPWVREEIELAISSC